MKLAILLLVLIPIAAAQSLPAFSTASLPAFWTASWTSAQQTPEPPNALPLSAPGDVTLRQTVHLSVGGSMLRIHLSNAFGTEALEVSTASLAHPLQPGSGAIAAGTSTPLTFAGAPSVSIPPGAEFVSDPVAFPAAPLSDVTVSLHLDLPAHQTGHPGSRATTWYVHGDQATALNLTGAQKVEHWYQLSAIDVLTAGPSATIVTLGDSITDGHGAGVDLNVRWPDVLAGRLEASPSQRGIGVANQGIGGNHLLTDGLGPNALARFDRDVLATAGVRWVIVLEGINDLGALARTGDTSLAPHRLLVQRLMAAYQQIVTRAHAHGLLVFGSTITPDAGSDYYHPTPQDEADRQQLNTWIRTPGHFDAVIDFDQTVRDPGHPDHLLPAFDSGDHLHPSAAGYHAMGDAVPLSLFR